MTWTALTRNWSSSRGPADSSYLINKANRGSIDWIPTGFEIAGFAAVRRRDSIGCAGIANPKPGSMNNIVEKTLYMMWKAIVTKRWKNRLKLWKCDAVRTQCGRTWKERIGLSRYIIENGGTSWYFASNYISDSYQPWPRSPLRLSHVR